MIVPKERKKGEREKRGADLDMRNENIIAINNWCTPPIDCSEKRNFFFECQLSEENFNVT
jgi:hypothetical protein